MSLFESKKLDFPGQDRDTQEKSIKDLQVGEKVRGYFKVLSVAKKTKRDGGAFLAMELMDKTGRIPAKIWDNADNYFTLIQEGSIYKINGYVNEYMSQKEIKVDGLRAISPSDTDFDEKNFIEKSAFDTGKVFRDMMEILKSNISSPYLLKLIDLFSQEYGEKFRTHYGAQKIHHAYMGGLLEHTYSMIKLAVFCADHYSLDKELLLTGVVFHDIGKLFEFSIEPTTSTTFEGGLLGHITIGCAKFLELKDKIPDFPEELNCKIQHLIISHHGEKEFGSPEVPKIPEAFVLHLLDMLDSRIKIIEETLANTDAKGLFTDYIHVLGRRLYVPPKNENPDTDPSS